VAGSRLPSPPVPGPSKTFRGRSKPVSIIRASINRVGTPLVWKSSPKAADRFFFLVFVFRPFKAHLRPTHHERKSRPLRFSRTELHHLSRVIIEPSPSPALAPRRNPFQPAQRRIRAQVVSHIPNVVTSTSFSFCLPNQPRRSPRALHPPRDIANCA